MPWFEVEQVAEDVYSIAEPGHYEYVRSYLVIGERAAALIDTGTGIDNIRREVKRLTDLPVRVILTHTHWDHMGNAHRFQDVAFYDDAGGGERRRLTHGIGHEELSGVLRPKYFGRPAPTSFDAAAFAIPPVRSLRRLEDNELIDLGGRTLRVLHTPRHSPGSISLLDEENGLLFVGDAFYYGPLYGKPKEFDLPAYRNAAKRLADLADRVDRVFPGHNELQWEGQPVSGADLKILWETLKEIKEDPVEPGTKRIYKADKFSVEISGS